MALIHIARDHKPFGTVTEEELRDGIFSGKFVSTDLVWREGMAEWKPLGEMSPQWGMETPAPALIVPITTTSASPDKESGTEPAWEERDRLGFFPAISRTVSAVLMRPAETFAAMKRTGGLADPLTYYVLLCSSVFAISVVSQLATISFGHQALPSNFPQISKSSLSIALIGSILISPAIYVISAFITAGLTHLFLKIIGGANKPFEVTFRVLCYAYASASCLILIPFVGWIIELAWGGYCCVIGLKKAHDTTLIKSIIALTLPGILCCGIIIVILAGAGFGIAELSKAGH